jgi:putative RNA 2'-phosphotransferase
MQNHKNISKFLSYILRHDPLKINLNVNINGWANVNELLEKLNSHGYKISKSDLIKIVENNDKQRFKLSDDLSNIRASQGHSIPVNLYDSVSIPPDILYHGTSINTIPLILKEGIKKMKRHHVHLSDNIETAYNVGRRKGEVKLLKVAALNMHNDGLIFYKSDNDVWLTDIVPPLYITYEN